MSETTLEAAPPTNGTEPSAKDIFRRHMEQSPTPAPAERPPEKQEKAAPTKDAAPKSDIPDSLLTGKPKEEAKPAQEPWDEEIPKDTRVGVTHFNKLKEASKARVLAAEAEAKALRAEMEQFRAKTSAPAPETAAELAALRERAEKAQAELERVAVERSERFQTAYTAKETAVRERAAGILKDAGLDDGMLDSILHSTGNTRERILSELELSEWQGRQLAVQMDRFDEIQGDKKQELSKASETLKSWKAEQSARVAREEQERKALEDSTFEAVGKRIAEKFEPFQKVEGQDEWNKGVDQRIKEAREFFNGNADLEKLAEITYYGLGAQKLHSMFATVQAKLAEALAENARLKSSAPHINGARLNGNGAHADENLPLGEAAKRAFNRNIA